MAKSRADTKKSVYFLFSVYMDYKTVNLCLSIGTYIGTMGRRNTSNPGAPGMCTAGMTCLLGSVYCSCESVVVVVHVAQTQG